MPDDNFSLLPLGSALQALKDGTHGTHPRTRHGIPFLSAKNIGADGQVRWTADDDRISLAEFASIHRSFKLECNDLLLTIVGSLGRCALHDGSKITFQRSVAFLRPDERRILARFLYHAVSSYDFQRELVRRSNATAQAGLYLGELARILVPQPDLSEQSQIADILDTVDAAIRRTEQVIAKLELVKKGLLHDLLTRGIDENGELRDPERHPEQFKESELGWIPRSWKVRRLDEVASVERGTFTHRPRNDPTFYGGRIPFIQTGDVTAAQGRAITHFSQTLNERGALVSKEFPTGTIAITIAAHIAETAVLGIPMYFPDSVVGAVVNSPNSIRFTELCIRRVKATLDAKAPQSAQKNINLRDLRPLRIPHPSPEEQDRVSEVYDSLLRTLSQEVKTRDKLRLVKKGLMEDLLTGKVRVTTLLEKGEALASATAE